MSDAQKNPFGLSIQRFTKAAAKAVEGLVGKSYPATVGERTGAGILKINYELTGENTYPTPQVPVIGSKYHRLPYQPGEKGMTISADTYLGGMSGQGGGTADPGQKGNLGSQAWLPVGSADWAHEDPDTHVIIGGPNGVLIKDATGAAVITLTASGINMSFGGHTVVINSSGVIIESRDFLLHTHKNVTSGAGTSGGVT